MTNTEVFETTNQEEWDDVLPRRRILEISTALIALLIGKPVFSLVKKTNGLLTPDQISQENQQLKIILEYIKKIYDLDIYNGESILVEFFNVGSISGLDMNIEEIERSLEIIIDELSKYPIDFFKKNHISSIRLIDNLRVSDRKFMGSVVAPYSIIFDYSTDHDASSNGNTLHHEAFHCIQSHPEIQQIIEIWKKTPYKYLRTKNLPAYEEMAYVAAALMFPSSHDNILNLIQQAEEPKKSNFQKKLDLAKQCYFLASNGKMNEDYWQALRSGSNMSDFFLK